jgi:putative membrane protein
MLAIVILHVVPPDVFALIHGATRYAWRGIIVSTFLCLAIGNVFENASFLTGFPFGHYYFTDRTGPKIFNVPILLGFAYLGIGYLFWMLGCIILGTKQRLVSGWQLVSLPMTASFIVVAWDLSRDPVWSTNMDGFGDKEVRTLVFRSVVFWAGILRSS